MLSKLKALFSPTQTTTPEQTIVSGGLVYTSPTLLKPMKWVMYAGKVGIAVDLSGAGFAVVHFVADNGETSSVARVPIGELTLARHLDIPESRRHPDTDAAALLGYV